MIEAAALDTTFLIDLQRSRRNEKRLNAEAWLENNATTVLKIPVVVLGEFASGFENPEAIEITELRLGHELLTINENEAILYSRLYRKMRDDGTLIGANDLWIAVIALTADLPLLSRNTKHFGRVEGLELISY